MTEKAEVIRQHVIEVLQSKGVTATPTTENVEKATVTYILQKDNVIEQQTFPPELGRRMLQYLQRRFGVAIHLFFTLETIESKPSAPSLVPKQPKSA